MYGACVWLQPVSKEAELENDKEWKVLTFQRTPVMSTYLLAFVVGEYDYVEKTDTDGVLVRVYTPVGKKDQGTFALEVCERFFSILSFFLVLVQTDNVSNSDLNFEVHF